MLIIRGDGWFSPPKALALKAFIRRCVAFGRQKEVDRRTPRIHGPVQVHPLPFNVPTIALTEGHRGKIAYVLLTDAKGQLVQVKIKAPSLNNWQGLAVRENGISDFQLSNKSFDLSYAGHDL